MFKIIPEINESFYEVICDPRFIAEREEIDYETSGRFITESWSTL